VKTWTMFKLLRALQTLTFNRRTILSGFFGKLWMIMSLISYVAGQKYDQLIIFIEFLWVLCQNAYLFVGWLKTMRKLLAILKALLDRRASIESWKTLTQGAGDVTESSTAEPIKFQSRLTIIQKQSRYYLRIMLYLERSRS
jgi:hypothetical protein